MRLSKRQNVKTLAVDMTPMIDIVFLLIIFFMTVSQVSKVNKERLELPKLEGSEDQQPMVMTINVDADGEISMSGEKRSLSQLVSLVGKERRRLKDVSLLTIVLRADQSADSSVVNSIVSRLAEMQIKKLRVAVVSPGT
jgi:biopolymer transport protein ExbD